MTDPLVLLSKLASDTRHRKDFPDASMKDAYYQVAEGMISIMEAAQLVPGDRRLQTMAGQMNRELNVFYKYLSQHYIWD